MFSFHLKCQISSIILKLVEVKGVTVYDSFGKQGTIMLLI